MPTLQAGQSVSIQLADGEGVSVAPAGVAQVSTRGVGGDALTAPRTLTSAMNFGPYSEAGILNIACLSGTTTYSSSYAPVTADQNGNLYANGAPVSGAGILSRTLAEMLALVPSGDGTLCSVTDLASGVRGLFQWSAASSKWRPASTVLIDRSLSLDSGTNSTSEQYLKSLSIPAGLLFTGCEIMLEYSLARSNTTDAGAAASFRVGNAGTISDTAFGNGSGFVSLTGSVRSFGNMHRYRVVSATQIEKLGAASTAGTSFAAAGSSVAAGAWAVGDTTARLHFAPTVQLAAATGSTLPQVGYMALWLLPS